jgi:glycosyltransferase involved in cell wall biosynthesis
MYGSLLIDKVSERQVAGEIDTSPVTNPRATHTGIRSQLSISVVVPVYNSAEGLSNLISRLAPVLANNSREYEVILVDDGSPDKSWEAIRHLHSLHEWIRGINLMRNYGQQSALLAGIRAARHELIVTIDDDLQNPPEEIPKLLAELTAGHDVVYGAPRTEQHGLLRDLASRIIKLGLQSAMGVGSARHVSAFRAFRRDVRNAFRHYDGPFVSIDVLLTWGTKRFSSVVVNHDPRREGRSNYSLGKLLVHALNLITGFSTLPLRIATFIGFAFTLVGLAVLLYVVCRFLMEQGSVPGFPFLASIISIFAGAQLCALGIIGEYIARMHVRSMGSPSSVCREQIGFKL